MNRSRAGSPRSQEAHDPDLSFVRNQVDFSVSNRTPVILPAPYIGCSDSPRRDGAAHGTMS